MLHAWRCRAVPIGERVKWLASYRSLQGDGCDEQGNTASYV